MDYERLSSLDDRSSLTSAVQRPLNKIIFFEFFILYFRTEKLLKNILRRADPRSGTARKSFFFSRLNSNETWKRKKKKEKACQEEFEQLWSESSINHGINHARPNNSNETIILDERLIGESSKIRGRSSENIRFSLFNSLPVPSQVQNRSAYLIQNASACLAFFFSSRKKTKTP